MEKNERKINNVNMGFFFFFNNLFVYLLFSYYVEELYININRVIHK